MAPELEELIGILAERWLDGTFRKDPKRLALVIQKLVTALLAQLKTRGAPDKHLTRALDLAERFVVVAERMASAGFVVSVGHAESSHPNRS